MIPNYTKTHDLCRQFMHLKPTFKATFPPCVYDTLNTASASEIRIYVLLGDHLFKKSFPMVATGVLHKDFQTPGALSAVTRTIFQDEDFLLSVAQDLCPQPFLQLSQEGSLLAALGVIGKKSLNPYGWLRALLQPLISFLNDYSEPDWLKNRLEKINYAYTTAAKNLAKVPSGTPDFPIPRPEPYHANAPHVGKLPQSFSNYDRFERSTQTPSVCPTTANLSATSGAGHHLPTPSNSDDDLSGSQVYDNISSVSTSNQSLSAVISSGKLTSKPTSVGVASPRSVAGFKLKVLVDEDFFRPTKRARTYRSLDEDKENHGVRTAERRKVLAVGYK